MKKAFLLALLLVLTACAPRTQDSGMAGEVRTESVQDDDSEMSMDNSGDMDTGGVMDMGTGGVMTGGTTTGGADGISVEMETATGGADADMNMSAETTDGGQSDDTEPPSGSLEAAASPAGPFYNDRPGGISDVSDERVVRVLPGSAFYLRVNYTDPSGISSLDISLRNSDSSGELPTGPFSIDAGAATSTCDDQLEMTPTELNCTIRVKVAANAQNISQAGEFAYVFRAQVIDGVGNSVLDNERGYVTVR